MPWLRSTPVGTKMAFILFTPAGGLGIATANADGTDVQQITTAPITPTTFVLDHQADWKVLIPPDAKKRKGARAGWTGGAYAWMRTVLGSEHGRELYNRRSVMIEPVFADQKYNRRIDRFQRRGRAAVQSEWRLINATHNLLKLHRHRLAAAAG